VTVDGSGGICLTAGLARAHLDFEGRGVTFFSKTDEAISDCWWVASVASPEFLGCRATARALEFRLRHLQGIMLSFFISIRSLLLNCKNEWHYT